MSFLVTAQIHTDFRFKEYTKMVEVRVNAALVEWGAIALDAVIAAETRIGDASERRAISPGVHLKDTFQMTVRKRLAQISGFGGMHSTEVVIWSASPNAIWQELGTKGRRRKAYKKHGPGKKGAAGHPSGGRGVTPLYFMRTGLRKSEPAGAALIAAALAGAGASSSRHVFDTTTPIYFD